MVMNRAIDTFDSMMIQYECCHKTRCPLPAVFKVTNELSSHNMFAIIDGSYTFTDESFRKLAYGRPIRDPESERAHAALVAHRLPDHSLCSCLTYLHVPLEPFFVSGIIQ